MVKKPQKICFQKVIHQMAAYLIWLRRNCGDFPGSPVVKNLPCNAGDGGSSPGWGTGISYASRATKPCIASTEPCITSRESVHQKERSHVAQLRCGAAK